MDPGHFLTSSGSKIPMPKSKKEVAVVAPLKPKLAYKTLKPINIIGETDQENILMDNKETRKVKPQVTSTKLGAAKSVPNLAKPSTTLSRSKTILAGPAARNGLASAKGGTSGIKRAAPAPEPVEVPASKQARPAAKTGFPYKAKNWELKARLAECEEWVVELRTRCAELEEQYNSNIDEVEELRGQKESDEENRLLLENQIQNLNEEKLKVQTDLLSKTESYNKLYDDSKQFITKIEKLEEVLQQKTSQLQILEADQSKLREDILIKDSTISQLKYTVDDLEFKTKRQRNQIEDLESSLSQTRSNVLELQAKLAECKSENSDLSENLQNAKSEICDRKATGESLSSMCDELKTKLCESEKLRRFLHNAVQDLKGNIRVFCRVRPPISSEKEGNLPLCSINFPDEGSLEISKSDPFMNSNLSASRPKFVKHEFSFDRVFHPSASQEDVFAELSQLVQSALDGYNVCVFAYGQTGSGKTFTMEGVNDPQFRGMIPRTVDHIFQSLRDLETIGWKYTVEVSFLEIYNENIRDLLRSDKEGSSLKVMQYDGKTNDVAVPGLTVMEVDSYESLDRLYVLAHQNRAVAYTSCNERSSRSHSVTKIRVTGVHQGRGEKCYGSLYLVDLAGSERLNEPMSDPRFREMKNINKSLSELGNVILGLLQKQEYVPYRNSKLTHLLQPALGGSSKTLMLVNISPAENCLQETLCSLRFAEKVNRVKMGASKKRIAFDNVSAESKK